MQPIIIKNQNVLLERRSVACDEPKSVKLLEHEGVVHAIELVCSCGEVTVLELEYDDRPTATEETH